MIHGGKPGAPITSLEMGTLWYKAQGLTYDSIALRLKTTRNSTQSAGRSVIRKLGVGDMQEAIRTASQRGYLGPYLDCGSRGARRRHESRGEPICSRCKIP